MTKLTYEERLEKYRKSKDSRGLKTEFTMNIVTVTDLTDEQRANVNRKARRSWAPNGVFISLGGLRRHYSLIDSREKVALNIWDEYGPGKYLVLFWNRFKRWKHFSKDFVCTAPRCKFYDNKRCKKWKWHKRGDSCKKNKEFHPNWSVRAGLTIEESDRTEDGWEFEWDYSKDRMKYMPFWKGEEKNDKEET